ncbi:MAG: bifunctional ornithine acetyltransferase/N-acetylglutamate synthase, partial [Terriglobales bacterium]
PFDEAGAQRRLNVPTVEIALDLGAGHAASWLWTCDLTEEYIRINASYRT